MKQFQKTILDITAKAADIPREYFRNPLSVDQKQDDSPVTVADRATEEFIRAALAEQFPHHSIFGEEFGVTKGESDYQWVIDPIDGTRSFISGMPLYGMLVALLHRSKPVLGVVRMPELAEVYHGDGQDAFLNGTKRLHTSGVRELPQAFLYINEALKIMDRDPETFARLNGAGRDQRFGFDCYPHMLVAAGHADACIDYDLQPYDFLSLVPIISAAGGVVTDWQGQPLGLNSDGRVISAATPDLHREILALLD